MQQVFTEMNTLGRIKSWKTMWQLKQLFKVGVLEEQRCLLYKGLKSLHGDYTAFLDDETFRVVYEPRGTYQEDFGELVRFLTRRYLSSHDFEGESMYKEMLEFLRDLDLDDLEQRQLQIDRNNDPSGPALDEMVSAREPLRLWRQRFRQLMRTMTLREHNGCKIDLIFCMCYEVGFRPKLQR